MKKLFEKKWIQELSILIFSFILFTLNDWILILSWRGFFMGVIYFLVLYSHAQVNRFLLLPILIKKNRPALYIGLSIVLLLLFSLLLDSLTQNLLYKNCFLYKSVVQKSYHYQLGILLGSLICIIGSVQFIDHYRYQRLKTNKELLSNQTQIDHLKKQLNPHFLFNTLNTIYGINLKFPERTSDLIIKVSQLLRYQVENTDREVVSLDDEIDFITSYIELERERVGYRCHIDFDFQKDSDTRYQIAPMLLITFIENAFKHGTCSIDDCFVKVSIVVRDGTLFLNSSNSIPARKRNVVSTRIGLENTKARLSLLYPKRYILDIVPTKKQYDVALRIKL